MVLRYDKRNVLGFAMDWADDWSKANFSVETTWIHDVPRIDNDSFDNLTDVDEYNLTVSIDRPTFINFLNANRTFFFNSQWFFQYVDGWKKTFTNTGPWNVLATFSVFTGFQQDRLLPFVTWVYDFQSQSGAILPTLIYRFSERFSASVGIATFFGRTELRNMPINEIAPAYNRAGRDAYKDPAQNLLSNFRDRDEVFLSLRYTF